MGAVQSTDEDNDSGDRRRHQQQQQWQRRTHQTEVATTLKPLRRGRYEPCSDDDDEGLCDSSGDDGYEDGGDVEEECRGGKTMTTLVTAADAMPQVAPTMTKAKAIIPRQTIVEISDRELVRQHLIGLAYPPSAIDGFLNMARSIVVSDASQASISTMLPLIPLDVKTANNPYKLAVSVHAKLQGSLFNTAALFGEEPRRPTAYTYMEGIVMGVGGFGRAAEPHHAAWVYDVAGRAVLDPMSISGCHGSYPIKGPLRYIGVSIVYSNVLKKTIPGAALSTRAFVGHHGSGAGRAGPGAIDTDDIGGYQVNPKGLIRSGLIVLD